MAGTVSGGKKAAQKNITLHGKDFYREIGRKGGRNGHTGGFAANPELAREAGRKGGKISKRVPASIKELRERITENSKLLTALQDYLPSEKEIKRTIRKSLKD